MKQEEKKRKKEKIMTFLVATNVVASRPPERRPTGTPSACANIKIDDNFYEHLDEYLYEHLKENLEE